MILKRLYHNGLKVFDGECGFAIVFNTSYYEDDYLLVSIISDCPLNIQPLGRMRIVCMREQINIYHTEMLSQEIKRVIDEDRTNYLYNLKVTRDKKRTTGDNLMMVTYQK